MLTIIELFVWERERERERHLADGPGASLGGGRVDYHTESAEEISTFEQKIAEKEFLEILMINNPIFK